MILPWSLIQYVFLLPIGYWINRCLAFILYSQFFSILFYMLICWCHLFHGYLFKTTDPCVLLGCSGYTTIPLCTQTVGGHWPCDHTIYLPKVINHIFTTLYGIITGSLLAKLARGIGKVFTRFLLNLFYVFYTYAHLAASLVLGHPCCGASGLLSHLFTIAVYVYSVFPNCCEINWIFLR